jgi:hypothetical protein
MSLNEIVDTLNRQGDKFSSKQLPKEVFANFFPGVAERQICLATSKFTPIWLRIRTTTAHKQNSRQAIEQVVDMGQYNSQKEASRSIRLRRCCESGWRASDVLDLLFAHVVEGEVELVADLVTHDATMQLTSATSSSRTATISATASTSPLAWRPWPSWAGLMPMRNSRVLYCGMLSCASVGLAANVSLIGFPSS